MKRMLDGSRSIKRGALFACAGLLATLLAACGGATAATPTRVPTIAAPTSAPTAAVAPTTAPTEAAAPTKAAAATAAPIGVGGTIALLLPETKTTRYETADRPDFEQQFRQLCPNCKIIYSNANQDANAQLSQAEVESAPGQGSTFMVTLPQRIATYVSSRQ